MKVAIFNVQPYEKDYLEEQANDGKHALELINEPLNEDTLQKITNQSAISITGETIDAEMAKKLKQKGVKMIAMRIAGLDRIDLKAMKKAGIKLANVPDYSPYAVAEHAVMLMQALNRKLIKAHSKVREYDFTLTDLVGFDMHGKTVGIIGMGKTGRVLAKILHGFGCKILCWNRSIKKELTEKYGIHFCSLKKLCKESDIISLHLPLSKETEYIIDKNMIRHMKKGVILINTARGKLVNIRDVIQGLVDEKIGALGIDVYENEGGLFFHDHSNDILKDEIFARLLSFKNVLITGHMAFLTHEALKNIAAATKYTLDCWEKGQVSMYEIE
ncbi:MAG: 2-hydroxyacid dehydrogenase [Cytophagaceae bacterium]